jgi:hypothetical protein
MPRQTYTSTILHDTDANFRIWGSQFSTALAACLTVTSDTGQINWTTVVRAGANTSAGYEMYRFSDTLQATKPVFIKVEYYTGSSTTQPMIRMTVSTGTNGAGTQTGLIATTTITNAAVPSANPQTTWICYKDGCFTWQWGQNTGAQAVPHGWGHVERSRDSTGASTGNGLMISGMNTNSAATPQISLISYDLSVIGNQGTTGVFIPCLASWISANSSNGAQVNLFNWFCMTPDLFNLIGIFTYKSAEIPGYTELDVALVATTSHHYVCMGGTTSQKLQIGSPTSTGGEGLGLLWEV